MAEKRLDADDTEEGFRDHDLAKTIVVSTGNSEIDKKLGGGIPMGSMTLIEGESDSGKSVLSQQMIWGSLYDGFSVVLYTTENTVKSFSKQMNSLSLDVSDFLLLGKLKIFPIMASKSRLTPDQVFSVLLAGVSILEKQTLVVVDSLTTFISHTSIDETMTGQSHLGEVREGDEDCQQVVPAPSCFETFGSDTCLGRLVLSQEVQRETSECSDVFLGVAGAHSAIVFSEGYVQDPV